MVIEISAIFIMGKEMVYNYMVFAIAGNDSKRSGAKMSNEREKNWIITVWYSTKSDFFSVFWNNEIIFLWGVMTGRDRGARERIIF